MLQHRVGLKQFIYIAVSILLGFSSPLMVCSACFANTDVKDISVSYSEIEKINDEILILECELFKLNTFFRLENGKQPAGRRWRMAYYQTTNYILTFAGLMINVIYNFYYYPRGGHATTIAQLSATTPRLVGKAVYLAGIIFETCLQIKEHYKEKKAGFDAPTMYKRVQKIQNSLDELFVRREQLVKNALNSGLSLQERKLLIRDGELLANAKRLALQEYSMLHARSVSLSTRNRLFNGLTFIKKADGDFGSDVVRVVAAFTHNSHLNPVASMSTTISGFMSAFDPWVEQGAERIVFNRRFHTTMKSLSGTVETDTGSYDSSVAELKKISAEINFEKQPILAGIIDRHNNIYAGMSSSFQSMQHLRNEELKQRNKHDADSRFYHAIYGGSKASRGVWLIHVGFRYLHAAKHAALLTGFAGIDNFAGATYRLAYFLMLDWNAFKNRKKDRAEAIAKTAVLKARLDALDALEQEAHNCSNDIEQAYPSD